MPSELVPVLVAVVVAVASAHVCALLVELFRNVAR